MFLTTGSKKLLDSPVGPITSARALGGSIDMFKKHPMQSTHARYTEHVDCALITCRKFHAGVFLDRQNSSKRFQRCPKYPES